jgi:hypothetical protein
MLRCVTPMGGLMSLKTDGSVSGKTISAQFKTPRTQLLPWTWRKGGPGVVLVQGKDFYSNPRLSPDGKRLAWLSWNLPNMPWLGTELWVGNLAADGTVTGNAKVAGGDTESIFQPEWSLLRTGGLPAGVPVNVLKAVTLAALLSYAAFRIVIGLKAFIRWSQAGGG